MSGVTGHAPVAGNAGGSSLPGLVAPSTRAPAPRFLTDVILELGLASPEEIEAACQKVIAAVAKATGATLR